MERMFFLAAKNGNAEEPSKQRTENTNKSLYCPNTKPKFQ